MIDKTHSPRKVKFSIARLESLLASGLEHASHGWSALEKEIPVNRLNPDSWPAIVEAPVGSAQYHLSIVIMTLYEAYISVMEEKEHNDEISKKVEDYLQSLK